MNKKIKTILFTLFVAGLLTVSCSSKDKTGPSSDNGDNPTIPTIPETGNGISSGYQKRYFFTGNPDYAEGQVTITSDNQILYTLSSSGDFRLDTQADGSILVKMPKLTEIGFAKDIIKIPAKNIVEGDNNYTIKTRYTLEESADKTVTVDLESENFSISGPYLTMKVKLTKTTATIVDGKSEVTEEKIYIVEAKPNLKHKSSGTDAISGTGAIEPKY